MVMTATYKVNVNGATRLKVVREVLNAAHAKEIQKEIANKHADAVALIALEDYLAEYTAIEVIKERNLLGGVRRYSTGTRTVTIPDSE
jgi:hypothetical protein